MIEPLLDAKEVAALLGVSPKWVYAHAAKGRIPCVHVGGLRRFEPAAIRAWLESNRAGSAQPLAKILPLRS
jgi:excisionase family DNA binding protein